MTPKPYEEALEEASLSALLTELLHRLNGHKGAEVMGQVLWMLECWGCPPETLSPMREWLSAPVANGEKLRAWCQLCGIEAKLRERT